MPSVWKSKTCPKRTSFSREVTVPASKYLACREVASWLSTVTVDQIVCTVGHSSKQSNLVAVIVKILDDNLEALEAYPT
jgi:hypothetical protein